MASLIKLAPSASPTLLKAQRGSSAAVRPAVPCSGIRSHRTCGLNTRAPTPMVSSMTSPLQKSSTSRRMDVRAHAEAEGDKGGMGETVILGALFAGWYAANIIFNIYNKTSLKAYPCPLTITCFQFIAGGLLSLFFWVTGLIKWPKITWNTVNQILPLAMVHTLGNLLTNVSLGAVAVSFTHTIKAMEPFFSVALSAMFLGDRPSALVLLTLLPIVGGVAAASLTEPSFNWTGFGAAMGSNLTFQSRNVLSKKLMDKKAVAGEEKLDKLNIFALITIFSGFLLAPFAIAKEGISFLPSQLQAHGVTDVGAVYQAAAIAALCFHTYQQVSYLILSRVSPVTHSIGNCVKRVIVIVASVIFFQNPVSAQNAIGTAVALLGVFLYSQVKRFEKNPKVGTAGYWGNTKKA